MAVAPARERGLKSLNAINGVNVDRRSREGAWIEIATCGYHHACCEVAPARERGLKCLA